MANEKSNNTRKNKDPLTPVVIISIIVLIAGIYILNLIAENSQNNLVMYIGIPILVSILVATIALVSYIKKMDTIQYKETATDYAVKDAFKITSKKDVFVRSVTTSRKIRDD